MGDFQSCQDKHIGLSSDRERLAGQEYGLTPVLKSHFERDEKQKWKRLTVAYMQASLRLSKSSRIATVVQIFSTNINVMINIAFHAADSSGAVAYRCLICWIFGCMGRDT